MSWPTTSASRSNILRMLASAAARSPWCRRRRRRRGAGKLKPDGVFLSNGPGDPEPCDYAIAAARELIDTGIPTFGICLGHQIMALASGAKTFKMKFGHHGANHPVKDLDTGRVSITSQNHGFAVDEKPAAGQPARHARQPVRRHAAGPGPHRQAGLLLPGAPGSLARPARHRYLFDRFIALMEAEKNMPKRTDIQSILIIGAGPIIIGQACEFDYSGVQACKALREEGFKVILINSNPARPGHGRRDLHRAHHLADGREDHRQGAAGRDPAHHGRPDGAELRAGPVAPRRAGQVQGRADRRHARSHRQGRRPPEVQGRHDQDRLGSARSGIAHSMDEAWAVQKTVGFPTVIRPSFTWAAPAAALPTTRKSSRPSASAAWKPRPPTSC
jgi:hypothetical protein